MEARGDSVVYTSSNPGHTVLHTHKMQLTEYRSVSHRMSPSVTDHSTTASTAAIPRRAHAAVSPYAGELRD